MRCGPPGQRSAGFEVDGRWQKLRYWSTEVAYIGQQLTPEGGTWNWVWLCVRPLSREAGMSCRRCLVPRHRRSTRPPQVEVDYGTDAVDGGEGQGDEYTTDGQQEQQVRGRGQHVAPVWDGPRPTPLRSVPLGHRVPRRNGPRAVPLHMSIAAGAGSREDGGGTALGGPRSHLGRLEPAGGVWLWQWATPAEDRRRGTSGSHLISATDQ